MDGYNETDFAKIIDQCEILIMPDNANLEDLCGTGNPTATTRVERSEDAQDDEENFESLFQESRSKSKNLMVSLNKKLDKDNEGH
jgi:hypothetical protein